MKPLKQKINNMNYHKVFLLSIILLGFVLSKSDVWAQDKDIYALVIGINDYEQFGNNEDLKYAYNDAIFYYDILKPKAKFIKKLGYESSKYYSDSESLFFGELAHKGPLGGYLSEIKANIKDGDSFYFIFSGHGNTDGKDSILDQNNAVLLLANAPKKDHSNTRTGIVSINDLISFCDSLAEKKNVKSYIILDACHSGRYNDPFGYLNTAKKINSIDSEWIQLISASKENAYELDSYKQGALTYAISKHLKSGVKLDKSIKAKITEVVKEITEDKEPPQEPIIKAEDVFFPKIVKNNNESEKEKAPENLKKHAALFIKLIKEKKYTDAFNEYKNTATIVNKAFKDNNTAENLLRNMRTILLAKLEDYRKSFILKFLINNKTDGISSAMQYSEKAMELVSKENYFYNTYHANHMLVKATNYYSQNNYDSAMVLVDNAIATDKNVASSLFLKANLNYKAEEYDKAFIAISKFLQLVPNDIQGTRRIINTQRRIAAINIPSRRGDDWPGCKPREKVFNQNDTITFSYSAQTPPYRFVVLTPKNDTIYEASNLTATSITVAASELSSKTEYTYFTWQITDSAGKFFRSSIVID